MAVLHTTQDHNGKERELSLTRAKAIRLKCLECSNFNMAEVRRCHIKKCAIWPFRLGYMGKPVGNSEDVPEIEDPDDDIDDIPDEETPRESI